MSAKSDTTTPLSMYAVRHDSSMSVSQTPSSAIVGAPSRGSGPRTTSRDGPSTPPSRGASSSSAPTRNHARPAGGTPSAATLRFLTGPNAGAELQVGADGAVDWRDLYPGHGLLQVASDDVCERELDLRHRKTARLELDLGAGHPLAAVVTTPAIAERFAACCPWQG